jgi:hypothetical protein
MRFTPKPCGVCTEIFSTPGALYEHRELAHQFQAFADSIHEPGVRPEFAKGASLEAVILTVTSDWHRCKVHGKSYQYYHHFAQHVLNEHVCHECGVLVENFAPHNREFHPVSEQCQHCGNIFPCGGLEPHLQQTQCDKLRCFKCNLRVSHISEVEHHRDHLCPGREVACQECGAVMQGRFLEEHYEYHRRKRQERARLEQERQERARRERERQEQRERARQERERQERERQERRERERQEWAAREQERLSQVQTTATQPVGRTVPCPYCKKLFKTVQGATDHFRQVHPNKNFPVQP